MLKMEVFDLKSINDVGVVMVFSVQKLCLFFTTVNISSFCNCDVLHKMLTYLYGYQFSNSCEI